ncbi:type II toxin-antitoxin system Phd/YefM family antitoxin [Xanthobacteraceae bacterium Astr-EGSB]|uniref:type II toxin-antitoxin system Phd/YefM family antitoxin n=1 Tax=Astrobacterium formosum TaxID=3069710 RepID=UPI0027AE2310|nr:type II toxin-antitoxin system Phd/YefM family antitoxin [Xanthobacteraceae bacterium Astr-EGSB]
MTADSTVPPFNGNIWLMSTHNIAEASHNLPELIDRALAGEGVVITRDGRPVVELKPLPATAPGRRVTPEDMDWLAARRVGRSVPDEDAGTLVSRMRDEGEK